MKSGALAQACSYAYEPPRASPLAGARASACERSRTQARLHARTPLRTRAGVRVRANSGARTPPRASALGGACISAHQRAPRCARAPARERIRRHVYVCAHVSRALPRAQEHWGARASVHERAQMRAYLRAGFGYRTRGRARARAHLGASALPLACTPPRTDSQSYAIGRANVRERKAVGASMLAIVSILVSTPV